MTIASPERTLEELGRAGGKLGYVVVGKKGVDRLPLGGLPGLAVMTGTARAATTGSQEIRQRAHRATPRIIRGSTKEKT